MVLEECARVVVAHPYADSRRRVRCIVVVTPVHTSLCSCYNILDTKYVWKGLLTCVQI
jgi:hypothetical protein